MRGRHARCVACALRGVRAAWRARCVACALRGVDVRPVARTSVRRSSRLWSTRKSDTSSGVGTSRMTSCSASVSASCSVLPIVLDVAAGDYKIAAFRHPLRYGTVFPRFAQ